MDIKVESDQVIRVWAVVLYKFMFLGPNPHTQAIDSFPELPLLTLLYARLDLPRNLAPLDKRHIYHSSLYRSKLLCNEKVCIRIRIP